MQELKQIQYKTGAETKVKKVQGTKTPLQKKRGYMKKLCNPLLFLVRLIGLEPMTYGLEVRWRHFLNLQQRRNYTEFITFLILQLRKILLISAYFFRKSLAKSLAWFFKWKVNRWLKL